MVEKKNYISVFLSVLIIFGILGIVSASTVCDSECDYTSIQDAIDAATSGDIIEVMDGTYEEMLQVNIDDLIIRAADGEHPIIQAPDEVFTSVRRLINLAGDGITFEGFEVVGNGNNDIDNVDNSYLAIRIEGEGITVEDNIVRDALTGIQTTSADSTEVNNILDNIISNVAVGISLQNDENVVTGNDISAINEGFGLASFDTIFSDNQIEVSEGGYEVKISGDTHGIQYLGSIQDGINAANEGDTVKVDAGEFAGAIINKNVKIIGEEDGTSVITSGVAYKPGNSNYMTGFRPEADGAEIRYFTINCDMSEDLGLGIYAVGVDDITVDSVTINNIGALQGITNWGGSNWIITNNIITDTVADNGGGIGIFIGSKANQQSVGNLVQNNQISATATAEGYSTPGIFLGLDLRYGGYDEIDGTEDVSGNQILDNIITSSGAPSSVGIEVGSILGNNEEDPDRTDPIMIADLMTRGIVHNNTLQDNIIDGAETGLYFYIVTNLTINQNEVRNSVENGIYAESAHQGVVIQSNKFLDNLFQILDDSGILLNAQYNYWGTDDGAEIAALVSDNVVYAPWFTDEEMTISTIGQSAPEINTDTGMVETEIEEEVTLSDGEITVTLPEEVVISTEDTDWDGTITPPTIKEEASVEPSTPGLTQTVSKVIEVGFSGAKLIFSKAVKIVIPGETGKKVGYSDGTTFTKITTVCSENSQTWADTNLPDEGECYYDDGTDIIIWTKHFTEFMTFDESDPEVPNLELYWYTPDFLQPEEFLNFFARFSDGSGVAYVQIRYIFTALLGSGGGFESEPDYENITLIDGTIYNGTWSPTDLPVPQTDGYYQIRLKADDLSGEGHEYYYPDEPDWLLTVTYDGTEPVTELLLDGSNYSDFITSTTEITLDATDPDLDDAGDYTPSDVNYIEYKIDGSYEEYTEAITITGDDGDYTVYYKSTDNAGNEEEEKSTTLTLDNTAPVTTDDSDSDWTDSDVIVTLSPTDDGSGVAHTYYCIYNNGEAECDPTTEGTSVSVTCAADSVCEQYVRYFSEDNLGNEESIKTSNLIRIDKQETTTSLTLGTPNADPYITSTTEITLECEDGDGSGCETIYYNSTGEFEEYTEAFTISGDDGDYIIEYYSVDAVGNIETTNQETLTLDNTEPTTTDDSSSYTDWQPSDVTITLSPSDTGSGVADTYYCIDETGTCTPTTEGTSVSVTCDADNVCQKYVRYFSVDDVENSEEVKTSGLIMIDKQNPVSTIVSPDESSIFASEFDASVEDSDNDGSGLATCEYQITSNSVVTQAWTSRTCGEDITITVGDSMNCRDEGDDICKLEIRSTDNVANVATVVERTFSIDYSNPPSILSSGPSETVITNWAVLEVETNKPATCKYDTEYKSDYDAMTYTMNNTGSLEHTQTITELADDSYDYYVICKDTVNNKMSYPATISFDVDTREGFAVTIPQYSGEYLRAGWNNFYLPSFVLENTSLEYNEELEGYEVDDVLESIEGSWEVIYHFDGTGWIYSYRPERPVNDLTHFNGGEFPYFIYMNVSGERIEIEY